jgi:queuine tRNA-ribosyltransferase
MFQILKQSKKDKSRLGNVSTNHGGFQTPIFMPPGTQATVKAVGSDDLSKIGIEILLVNTLHLSLQPGENLIYDLGGVHSFMGWSGPILSDSGGFQAWSFGKNKAKNGKKMAKISENGVEFFSPIDGSKHLITPEKSIEIQYKLGTDIVMAFDECSPDNDDKEYAKKSMQRTHKWAQRSLKKHQELSKDYLEKGKTPPLIFGIIQGGIFEDLRKESAKFITDLDFDGIALGGETIGYNMPKTLEILDYLQGLLPKNKPRYTMGLGSSAEDIIEVVKRGVDMFDCVAPTRMARHGSLYTKEGNLRISNSCFEKDNNQIDKECDCYTCQNFSRAYLHHLYSVKEPLYLRLASIHNLRFMMRLIGNIRNNI